MQPHQHDPSRDAPDSRAEMLALSVVIPAFNEAEIIESSVGTVAEGLRARGLAFEILVVENGSTDDTATIADRLAQTIAEVRVEHLPVADYGAALRHGLLYARGAAVVNFDCDYFDLEFLDAAVPRVADRAGPAVVVGSKRAPGANDTRAPLRRAVTAVFTTVLRVVFGLQVSDTHGMKAMRREAVESLARDCRFGRDLFDTELILRAEHAGLRTDEIPVAVRELRPARTSILRRVPRTLVGLVRLRWALWRERR
jgi:glycosyltransferase involved in cell wall biosynthesis